MARDNASDNVGDGVAKKLKCKIYHFWWIKKIIQVRLVLLKKTKKKGKLWASFRQCYVAVKVMHFVF